MAMILVSESVVIIILAMLIIEDKFTRSDLIFKILSLVKVSWPCYATEAPEGHSASAHILLDLSAH